MRDGQARRRGGKFWFIAGTLFAWGRADKSTQAFIQ